MRIILDPGHGGSDPGAVLYALDKTTVITTEREENLKMSLTLKEILTKEYSGATVELTRTTRALPSGDEHTAPSRTSFAARTYALGACDLYMSVHFDWSGAGRKKGGVYFSGDRVQALKSGLLAARLAKCLGGWCTSDVESNHGRLYIRDARTRNAVLWEVSPLRVLSRAERIEKARTVAYCIANELGLKKTGVMFE